MFERSNVEPQAERRSCDWSWTLLPIKETNVTAIVYAEFENLMEINSNRTVQYDVY